MKVGEIRRITMPYYLGYGIPGTEKMESPTPLYIEVELVEFMD